MQSMDELTPRGRSFAYATALLVNFIDQLGGGFLIPVIFPIGQQMGATLEDIAFWGLVRGFFMLFSTIGLSKLSDVTSRRLAVTLSIGGSGLAYFIQAYAAAYGGLTFLGFTVGPILLFTIGRAVAGMFAGTSPVLRAFVSDLYSGDAAELKQKMVTMQVASQALGLALSPIAGSITRFYGLAGPIWISFAASCLGVLWVLAFFPKGATEKEEVASIQGGDTHHSVDQEPGPNPYCDAGVMSFFFMFIFMATLFAGNMGLLIPNMLMTSPDLPFVHIPDPQERAEQVAQAQGLLGLPSGLASMFVSLFLFTPVTERFGEGIPLVVSGLTAALLFRLFGYTTSMTWLYTVNALVGACFGMIFPAVGPIMAKYATAKYPSQKAQVQAIPMMGMSIGMMLGPNLLAYVQTNYGDMVWWFATFLCATASILMFIGDRIVNSALDSMEAANTAAGSMQDMTADPKDFAKFAASKVEEYLLSHADRCLKFRPVQALVMARLLNSMPDLPPFDEETHGQQTRRALYHQMGEFEGLREEYAQISAGINQQSEFQFTNDGNIGMERDYHAHIEALSHERRVRRRRSANPGAVGFELSAAGS